MRRVVGLALLLASLLLVAPVAHAYDVTVTIGVGDNILRVFGKTSPQAFVTIKKDGAVIGTVVADVAGAYEQTYPAQEPGIHQLALSAQTTSGAVTDEVTLNVNIAEHATTSVGVFLPPTLYLANANLALNEALMLSGETAPVSTVSVYIDNTNYASTISDAQGVWQITVPTNAGIAPGQHELFVRATDGLGEQSHPTTPRYFFVTAPPDQPVPPPVSPGTLTPRAPVITSPKPGTVWRQPTLTVQGTADGNVQIELWDGGSLIGSVWSGGRGDWSIAIYLQQKDYELRARACLNQRCSGFSESIRFKVELEEGNIPAAGEPLHIVVSQASFVVYQNQIVPMRATVVTGTAPYKATIQWGDGQATTRTYDGKDLSFPHSYAKPGRYTVAVEVQDALGRKNKLFYTVDVRGVGGGEFPWQLLFGLLVGLLLIVGAMVAYRKRHKDQGRKG